MCDTRTFPEDFDRSYYPSLKSQYAHLPNVRIFSKDDYTLDPQDTPHLFELRGRSLKAVRAAKAARPRAPDELAAPHAPFRRDDMHTPEEVASFEARMRTHDAVSGRAWEDPMPESDFEFDEDSFHFRKYEPAENVDEEDDEEDFEGCENRPGRRRLYATYEDELADVTASMDRMQAESVDEPSRVMSFGEQDPTPEAEDFARWQRAAAERGGNSTQHESYDLSPVRPGTVQGTENGEVPRQFESLSRAHVGKWKGLLKIYDVNEGWGDDLAVFSEILVGKSGLKWNSTVEADDIEVVSRVTSTFPKFREVLAPGRAVSADGSFVSTGESVTLGAKFVNKVTSTASVVPEIEICMISTGRSKRICRHRVILCCEARGKSDSPRGGHEKFEKVIVISEHKVRHEKEGVALKREGRTCLVPTASFSLLQGTWAGKGVIMLPRFPPFPCREVSTKRSIRRAANISLADVTWVENDIEDAPGRKSRARQRSLAKKKTSKRVSAAQAHDRKRLAECSFLACEEAIGDAPAETHAWKAMPSENEFSKLFSPRLGKFVDDYCGVVIPGPLLLTFPATKSFPNMWNTICLTQLHAVKRKRISAGRSIEGDLVGALFISEAAIDSDLCDDVASYV